MKIYFKTFLICKNATELEGYQYSLPFEVQSEFKTGAFLSIKTQLAPSTNDIGCLFAKKDRHWYDSNSNNVLLITKRSTWVYGLKH